MKLLLGSSSPRRLALLKEAGYSVECVKAHCAKEDGATAEANATIKAHEIVKTLSKEAQETILITADTMMLMPGTTSELVSKPESIEEAHQMFSTLMMSPHKVSTGVCMRNLFTGEERQFTVTSIMTLKRLTEDDRNDLFIKSPPLDKAGGYDVSTTPEIIDTLEGSYSSVVGLPIDEVKKILQEWNVNPTL